MKRDRTERLMIGLLAVATVVMVVATLLSLG